MLQFITDPEAVLTVAEQVQAVMEGGCMWIELAPCAELRQVAEATLPVCRKSEAFLMIDDDVDLVEELRVHGVHLSHATRQEALSVRERLGAHAVIGISCVTAADAIALKGCDADYVTFAVEPIPEGIAAFAKIAAEVAAAETGLHIVARGEFPADLLPEVLRAGAAGVAMSRSIAAAPDPAAYTADIIKTLNNRP